jgi:hypothetical protein
MSNRTPARRNPAGHPGTIPPPTLPAYPLLRRNNRARGIRKGTRNPRRNVPIQPAVPASPAAKPYQSIAAGRPSHLIAHPSLTTPETPSESGAPNAPAAPHSASHESAAGSSPAPCSPASRFPHAAPPPPFASAASNVAPPRRMMYGRVRRAPFSSSHPSPSGLSHYFQEYVDILK